ncbi:MAG: acetate--CoA ligase family protein [Hyphomicrobiaceae bacterium]
MTDRNAEIARILDAAIKSGATALDEATGKSVLGLCGIETPRGQRLGRTPVAVDIERIAGDLRPPWVLKALSTQPIHKSEFGAVRLDLKNLTELKSAVGDFSKALDHQVIGTVGYLVEETAPAGVELIVGGYCDSRLGPIVMVGLGGTLVEVFKDIAYRICPIDRNEAGAMLDELTSAPILKGTRGAAPLNRDAIIATILAVAGAEGLLTQHAGLIAELDINPLIASTDGAVAADARIILGEGAFKSQSTQLPAQPGQDLAALFAPHSVAVAGASATAVAPGNRYLRALRAYGYAGDIYPIHPSAETIDGLRAYPSLGQLPSPVDYAYIAVAAPRVADVLDAVQGKVRFAQIIASGFSEATADDAHEQQLLQIARRHNMRLLGPNCLGTHCPRANVTFVEGVNPQPGSVGIVSQSGGIGMDILKRGQAMGLQFSGLVTIGNSVDVAPHELLQYFIDDPVTQVIGLYLEDLKDGRAFMSTLIKANCRKPIVVLTGGLTNAGRTAAGSHTGAMTTDAHIWQAIARQTGLSLATGLDTFLDALLIFQTLPVRPERRERSVILFGNGGGTSVLGSDHLARAGLTLANVPASVRQALTEQGVPEWISLANPVDVPAVQLKSKDGETAGLILRTILDGAQPNFLVVHLNLPVIIGYRDIPDLLPKLVEAALSACRDASAATDLALVLRSDGSQECDDARRTYRTAAAGDGVPVFDEVDRAATALSLLCRHETVRLTRVSG